MFKIEMRRSALAVMGAAMAAALLPVNARAQLETAPIAQRALPLDGEVVGPGYTRVYREERLHLTPDRLNAMLAAGKSPRLDPATGEQIVQTFTDHLPAGWILEAPTALPAGAKIDSFGNPIINDTPGLPAWAQRDVNALRAAIVQSRDDVARERAAGRDAREAEGIFGNFIAQAITRAIPIDDLVNIDDPRFVNASVAAAILGYLHFYENIRFVNQEVFHYTYTRTAYPARIAAFASRFGSSLAAIQSLDPAGYSSRATNCYTRTTFARGFTNLSGQTDIWVANGFDDSSADIATGLDAFYFLACDDRDNNSSVRVSTNGYITFFQQGGGTLDGTNFTNDPIPAPDDPDGFIAPWWDDLVVATAQGSTDRVSYKTEGAIDSRVFTVEWISVSRLNGDATDFHYFQVKLYETSGIIELHYGLDVSAWQADALDSATTGLENYAGTAGDCGVDCTNTRAAPPPNDYRFTPLRSANDLCADAQEVIEGARITADLLSASPDGNANCGDSSNNRDLWYVFNALCNGTLTVSACGSRDIGGAGLGVDTVLSAHSACPGTVANQLACDDDAGATGCSGNDAVISVPVTVGQRVLIRATHFGDIAFRIGNGQIALAFDFTPTTAPANDACSNAIVVGGNATVNGSLACATNDGAVDCGSSETNADVWYTFIAPCHGTLAANLCGSRDLGGVNAGTDTVLSFHSGCPGTIGNEIVCNDDGFATGCNTLDSAASAVLDAGQRVWIRVSHFGSGTFRIGNGRFVLHTIFTPDAPANDLCANATLMPGNTGSTTGELFCATSDGPGGCGAPASNRDVWYRWHNNANRAGRITFNTCGTNDSLGTDLGMDTVLNALNSCATGAIGCNDDGSPRCAGALGNQYDSRLTVVVGANRNILLRVSHFSTSISDGRFNLHWNFNPCVADFDDGSGAGTPDGGVTLDDLLYYLDLLQAGDPAADVDDGSGLGIADGGVTLDDLLFFLEHFEAGC